MFPVRLFSAGRKAIPAVSVAACSYHETVNGYDGIRSIHSVTGGSATVQSRTYFNSINSPGATTPPPLAANQNTSAPPLATNTEKFTMEISNYVSANKLSDEVFQQKYEAVMALEEIAQQLQPQYAAFITGSSMNGAGTKDADTDVTLINTADRGTLSRVEAQQFLGELKTYIERSGNYSELNLIATSKVPLLSCRDRVRDVPLDITLDGASAVRNTYMLQLFSSCDYRVGPMLIVIKNWAKAHEIKEARHGLLSSYGITLLVLHYLQVQEPWVVPCLHREMKDYLYADLMNMRNMLSHDLPTTPTSHNLATLGDLICGFFQYYASFPFESKIIQVAEGHASSVDSTTNPAFSASAMKRSFVKIEEPFSKSNVAHSIAKRAQFMRIRTEFVVAGDALFFAKEPSLASIGLSMPSTS